MKILKALTLISAGIICCGGEDKAADFSSPAGIKAYCGEDILCYHDKIIELNKPEWCETINDYWEDHDQSLVGSCYHKIALKTKDKTLCEKIKKKDIRNKCLSDLES